MGAVGMHGFEDVWQFNQLYARLNGMRLTSNTVFGFARLSTSRPANSHGFMVSLTNSVQVSRSHGHTN